MGYMMPFFFIMSGYNFKPGVMSYGACIRKRAKQLLIPLLNYTIAIWVLLGAYLCLRGETDVLTLLKSFVAYWLTDPVAGWVGLDASRTLVGLAMRKYNTFGEHETKRIWLIINTLIARGILIHLQMEVPGVGMISGGRIAYKMGAVEVFVTLICGVLGTMFLMSISKWLVRFKHLGAFLAYVGQNSLIVLILHGAIMRIFCDIFGFTGAPAGTFGLVNLAVFAATLFTSVLFIYIKGLMNNWTQKKKQAIRP